MKRKRWLLLLASACLLRVGLDCAPEPDLTDPLGAVLTALGWI